MKHLVAFVIVFTACSSPSQQKKDPWNGFHPDELERAWENKDSVVVNNWIVSLSDSSLPDWKFYGRVAELSRVTGFYYGNADPSEKSYFENIPQNERRIHRRNVSKVYLCYRKSCLFMKKADYEETLPLQDRYWNDTADIESHELKMLSQALDSICLNH
jgi:hypothetical protein